MRNVGFVCRVFLLACVWLHPRAALHADGGMLRWSERKQNYQITVFTSPAPLRSGPIDVSVLVQDATTGEPVPQVRVLVRATPRGYPAGEIYHLATPGAATNKLFRAAVFDLPEPGLWDVEIVIEEPREPIKVHFEMEADEPLPRLEEMWLWIAWPVAAILFFVVHQQLVRRRVARQSRTSLP